MAFRNSRSGFKSLARVTNVLLAVLAVIALYFHFFPVKKWIDIAPGSIRMDKDGTYWVSINSPHFLATIKGDKLGRSLRSQLFLYENTKPLGPAHSLHQEIRTKGEGRFSHWGNDLVFSASDNSDPRTNGRQYTVSFPVYPPALLVLLLGLNLIRLIWRWYRMDFSALADRTQSYISKIPNYIKYIILYALIAAAVIISVYQVLRLPVLFAEDGDYFARFYNSGRPEMILLINAGYMRLTSNLLYYTAIHLPPTWAPYFLTWLPTLLTVFVYGLFFARRYRLFIPSDSTRFLICLALTLSPLGNHLLVANSDYSSWNMLFLLCLLSSGGRPRKHVIPSFLALNIAVWGTPLALVALPVLAGHWLKDRSRKATLFYFPAMLNILIHHWWAADSSILALNMELVIKWLLLSGHLFINQEILIPLLGPAGARTAMESFPYLGPALFVVFSALVVRFVYPKYKTWTWLVLYFMAALNLAVMAGRETTYNFMGQDSHIADRYFYIQSLLCLSLLVLLVHTWINGLVGLGKETLAKIRLPQVDLRALKIGAWSLLLLYLVLLNTVPHNRHRFKPKDVRNGPMVRKFFHDLELAQKADRSGKGITMRLDKHYDWPIVIDTTTKDR